MLLFFFIPDNAANNGNFIKQSPLKAMDSKLHTSPSAPPGYIDEVTDNMSIKDSKSSVSLEESKKSDEASRGPKKEVGDDEMQSSDDSYVKVRYYFCLFQSNLFLFLRFSHLVLVMILGKI